MFFNGHRFLTPGIAGNTIIPAVAVIECRCASIVVFNGDDGVAIVIDIDVEAPLAVALESCAGGVC